MKVFTGEVTRGAVQVPEDLPDGTRVAILAPGDEGFRLSPEEETELEHALQQIRSGEFVDGRALPRNCGRSEIVSYGFAVAPRAASQIRAAARWLKQNRPKAPSALVHDLESAYDLIQSLPNAGDPCFTRRIQTFGGSIPGASDITSTTL